MTMAYISLDLNIGSANNVKDVNRFTTMNPFAKVSVFGDRHHPQNAVTDVHKHGGTNPTWNYPVKLTVNELLVQQNCLYLDISLISDRIIHGETLIGTVHIPLKDLFDNPAALVSVCQVSYPVIRPSGDAKGILHISYKFGERVVANPPPGSEAGSSSVPYGPAVPPPQHASGYSYPPPAAGYPPQQGYGYPAGQRPQNNNRYGMGLVVGDALTGAMLVENVIADVVVDGGDE